MPFHSEPRLLLRWLILTICTGAAAFNIIIGILRLVSQLSMLLRYYHATHHTPPSNCVFGNLGSPDPCVAHALFNASRALVTILTSLPDPVLSGSIPRHYYHSESAIQRTASTFAHSHEIRLASCSGWSTFRAQPIDWSTGIATALALAMLQAISAKNEDFLAMRH